MTVVDFDTPLYFVLRTVYSSKQWRRIRFAASQHQRGALDKLVRDKFLAGIQNAKQRVIVLFGSGFVGRTFAGYGSSGVQVLCMQYSRARDRHHECRRLVSAQLCLSSFF